MQGRDTHLAGMVRETGFSNFLLFPLPLNDPSYREYARKVRDNRPASDLRIVRAGQHEFVMAPISDLSYLFPRTAQYPDVYTARHFGLRSVYNR